MIKQLAMAISVLTLTACTSTGNRDVVPDDPYYAPLLEHEEATEQLVTGSLFDSYLANDLYSDKKALRSGDIITVMLTESTQASKSAKTETDRETAIGLQPITGLGGQVINIGKESIQFGLNSDSSYSGDAKSNQSNSLSGNISVNVMRVLPNGNLVIRGEKWLTLNTGEEFIRLEGIVRAKDISADNTVESTRIANARIQYSGKGELAETQSPGWLSKFFLGALFPF